MNTFIRAIAVVLLASASVEAAPQGSWPEDMRGHSLPAQDWIMIIPATRLPDGTVSVWNRSDSWNREWVVPKATPAGTRTVAVNGDSEDMRIVTAPQIDNMSVSSLSRLAGKYGASAIAVVVAEEGVGVAVAAWAKGNYATWDMATEADAERRNAALQTLDRIFSGADAVAVDGPHDGEIPTGGASILGQRFDDATGRMEYRISGDSETIGMIETSGAFTVTSRNHDVPPSVDVIVNDGRDVEEALFAAGVRLR